MKTFSIFFVAVIITFPIASQAQAIQAQTAVVSLLNNNPTNPNDKSKNSRPYITENSTKGSSASIYMCGNQPCEGMNVDYFANGQVRLAGVFANGLPVDTLKEYYETGVMARVLHPDTENGFEKLFYPSGQIKRAIDNHKDFCTYFYDNGNLWLSYTTTEDGGRANLKQYYENGQVRLEQNGNTLKGFFQNGKLAYKIKRSEPFWAKRILSGDNFKYFSFHFEGYNEAGVLTCEINFTGADFEYKNGFPQSMDEINPTNLDKIVRYNEQGQPVSMEEFEYVTTTRYNVTTYSFQNGDWKKENTEARQLAN